MIVCIHDGGWVIADLNTYEASAMALAKKTGAIVADAAGAQDLAARELRAVLTAGAARTNWAF